MWGYENKSCKGFKSKNQYARQCFQGQKDQKRLKELGITLLKVEKGKI
jgi:hypothetical protein